MTQEETILLKELLIKFFDEAKFGSPNFLKRNPIAYLLKTNLLKLGYWKNRGKNFKPKQSNSFITEKFAKATPKIINPNCPF